MITAARPQINLDVTTIFHKNWTAITATNEDGSRKYRYIINTGSSRSSKTFSLIDCYDIYARSNKNKRCTVWRDTKTDTKKTVMNDALRHFKNTGRYDDRLFNKTESIFHYRTGSTFEIHGTDDENTVHGLNQDAAWFNEPYDISRDVFDQIDQRTADFVIIDWNPKKGHWVEDIAKDPRAIVIHSTFDDNPFCPPEQRNKILSYQPVSMCEVVTKKFIEEKEAGEYNFSLNERQFTTKQLIELQRCIDNENKRSANAFNWSVYGLGEKAERPNRIYHFEECSVQEFLNLNVQSYHYSDWGAVDPWAIGEVKYYDGCLYIREKNYESENNIRARLTMTEREQISTADEGLVSWMFYKLGIPQDQYVICDTNRPNKILALRNSGWDYAVGLTRKDTGAVKSEKVDGIDLLNNLKVFYTSDSPNIKYEQENYSRRVDRYGIVLEEPEDMEDHHMDGARYVALFLQAQGIIHKV